MHIPHFDEDVTRVEELCDGITAHLNELHHLLLSKSEIAGHVVDHENQFEIDMCHLLESRKMNAAEGTQMSKHMAESRVRRRSAKNFLEYHRRIQDLVAQANSIMMTVNYRITDQKNYVAAKAYTFRTPLAWDILDNLQDRSHKHALSMVQPPKDAYEHWDFEKLMAPPEEETKEQVAAAQQALEVEHLPTLYRFTYDEGSFILINSNDNFSEWSIIRFRDHYATYSKKLKLATLIREIGLFSPDHILYARDNQIPMIRSHVDNMLQSDKQDSLEAYRFVKKELPKARNVTQHSTNQMFAYAKKHFKHLVV